MQTFNRVGNLECSEHRPDTGQQFLYLQRFGQEIIGSGLHTRLNAISIGLTNNTSIDIETATDFVVGANGGSLTIDAGGPYTFDDTARLAIIPVTARYYRVRLVP